MPTVCKTVFLVKYEEGAEITVGPELGALTLYIDPTKKCSLSRFTYKISFSFSVNVLRFIYVFSVFVMS